MTLIIISTDEAFDIFVNKLDKNRCRNLFAFIAYHIEFSTNFYTKKKKKKLIANRIKLILILPFFFFCIKKKR